jgi:hypothetical protein
MVNPSVTQATIAPTSTTGRMTHRLSVTRIIASAMK